MGNKMKKLICALLASAMLVGSVGVVGFADEDTNAETVVTTSAEATEKPASAEATEAPASAEATEAPVATVAPTTSGSSYDNDSYYDKALSLCSALGIITGYEDGSVKPDSKVTRAEMASIVLRMLDLTSTSTYQNGFTDVTSSHWAADQIQTALEANIINGMGDGTFVPDGEVTYAQVCVMLVNAMNYQDDAEYYGGYPNGYIKVAGMSDLEITKNAPGAADVASDRGVVIKMVYNALLGQYKEINGYENGAPTYKANGTLAKAKFDVIDKKGVLTATSKTSVSSTDVQDGQIEIVSDDDDEAKLFDCDLTGLEDYLAQKITYYYKENSGLTPKVLAVTYDASKTTTFKADADDIQTVEGFDTDAGKFKIEGVSKKKDCAGASIVYNGKIISNSQLAELGESINDLLLPEKGSIRLVDSDKDDVFDVVFVDSYDTMIVTSASNDKLIGKVAKSGEDAYQTTEAKTITLDDSEDRTISVKRAGADVKLRNLKKNDVASIKRSLDDTVVDIVVTGESFTGSASGVSIKYNNSYATVNGTKYDVANVATGDLKTGVQSTFYTDMFGRIAYVESSVSGRLQTGEAYGWLIDTYKGEGSSDYVVSLMTQDGKNVEYTFANSVSYWAPKAVTGGESKSKTDMETIVQNLLTDDSNFAQIWGSTRDTSGYVEGSTSERRLGWYGVLPVRLVKYKVNSSNKITKLYFAVSAVNGDEKYYDANSKYVYNRQNITDTYLSDAQLKALKDSDALIIDPFNKSGSTLKGGLLGGYQVTDDTIEFGVPNDKSNLKNTESYTIKKVTASQYNLKENGISDTYIFADMDGVTPAAVVRLVEDTTKPVNPADLDNVGNTPAMVVDEISYGVDDEDNRIYTISGYSGGAETSVTTSKISALAELTGYKDKKYATGDVLWNADSSDSIEKYLHKGDIIITDGKYILLYSCVKDVYDKLKAGESVSKYVSGSDTRNYYYFDQVSDLDIGDTTWMDIGSNKVILDASKVMDTVEIDLSKPFDKAVTINTDGLTIADLNDYDSKKGEYLAFARFANKGSLYEVMIYDIKDETKSAE